MSKAFGTWLNTLVEEKGIDFEETFVVSPRVTGPFQEHVMSYGVVIEALREAPTHEQRKIKDTLVVIDFKNGDIKEYLRYLGMALAMNSEKAS